MTIGKQSVSLRLTGVDSRSGQYNDAFIEYTAQMLKKCKEYGFRVIMDPHQDIVKSFAILIEKLQLTL